MPYIPMGSRATVLGDVNNPDTSVGELNFIITTVISRWMENKGLSYGTINSAIGVLECAKQELYRRVAVPYENLKRKEAGDVYPESLGGDTPTAGWGSNV